MICALVQFHNSVRRETIEQGKRQELRNFISPRDYLDFIKHYVDTYNIKRDQLEDQQLHLNVGLDKLKETSEQVEELQISLAKKEKELASKNTLANEKLKVSI